MAARLAACRVQKTVINPIHPRGLARYSSIVVTSADAQTKPIRSVLIANRGEIALRVGRTAEQHGIRTTTLYTNPDAVSQHALSSPFAVNLGNPTAYLDGDAIIEVARAQQCDGIHPGYGFLSENSSFARKCNEAGITFIGPPWEAIEAMGNKSRSKEIMSAAGVPCVPGYHGDNQDPSFLQSQARNIGFPVLLKAVKGGGGKGMRISQSEVDFQDQLASAKSEALNSFGDDTMLVEKYITTPRHIEVQIFADKFGGCVALGERDCSIQRRHQKILEESPAPSLDDVTRRALWEKARAAALAVKYEGAGTVEFIFDNETEEFFFMEMNTRLQVEHPVTEMVTGQDLVLWQFLVAEGKRLPLNQDQIEQEIQSRGCAIEARIYAENPDTGFVPDSGKLLYVKTPRQSDNIRIDAGFVQGDEISSHYDPMIAKLIVQGSSRTEALQKMTAALGEYQVAGPSTNIQFLQRVCGSQSFMDGQVETGFIQKHQAELFKPEEIQPETWAQAALGLLLQEIVVGKPSGGLSPSEEPLGFDSRYSGRTFSLTECSKSGASDNRHVSIEIRQVSSNIFDITVDGHELRNVRSSMVSDSVVQTFFPYSRIETTVVRNEDQLYVFQQRKQYKLRMSLPPWVEKALGSKDTANSVLAPMPCKVLKVNVAEGDEVVKDQPLIVIESMKMETVIRSPQAGTISKVIHKVGDICKAGTALVEFGSDSPL